MEKVAIVTITNSGLNYGNRLQNYALQTKLEQYGVRAETIYSSKIKANSLLLSKMRRFFKKILKNTKRRKNFNAFNRKYIKSAKRIRYGKLNEYLFANEYIAFISGSDQVWNPHFHFNSDFEFLSFADPQKRFSYAASFGVDSIPAKYYEEYKKLLQQLQKISVREEEGRRIVLELTGRDALVHIDPTMLLTQEDYISIEEKPLKNIPSKYLLIYFLGEKTEEYWNAIRKLGEDLKLEIIEMSEDKKCFLYEMGPQHFLYLFHHADYICTDSFHGTVFSILFQKKFAVFGRKDNDMPMNSRLNTLLEKMQLKERFTENLDMAEMVKEIDYSSVNAILKDERYKAHEYFTEISDKWKCIT